MYECLEWRDPEIDRLYDPSFQLQVNRAAKKKPDTELLAFALSIFDDEDRFDRLEQFVAKRDAPAHKPAGAD